MSDSYYSKSRIVTELVLNDKTGELEQKQFEEITKIKGIKGGFVMVYKSYEEAIEQVISSKKDYAIVVSIKNQFTYDQVEVNISHEEMAKDFEVSRQKITTIIKSMVDNKILMRVRKGIYRLNPFMYLPYRSEGVKLQSYWKNLVEQEKLKSQS